MMFLRHLSDKNGKDPSTHRTERASFFFSSCECEERGKCHLSQTHEKLIYRKISERQK